MPSWFLGRLAASGAFALTASFGLAGCAIGGGDVSKSDVVAQLKADKESEGVPERTLDCIADALIKHGNKDDVKELVDGKKKFDDVKPASDKNLDAELDRCVAK